MISSTMNLVMTILGFAMSATFVVFVCARLLCVRMQQRHHPRRNFDSTEDDVEERSPRGMEPSVVASFPTVKYSQDVFSSKDDALCTVCLGEYEEKDVLRVLPRCGHAFHIDCIDAWLRHHSTCPICRISLCSGPDGSRCIPSPLITQAARSRFSHEAVPDNMFEQQQQDSCEVRLQANDMSAQEVEGSSHSHSRRWAGVGEATEIFWHRSRRQRHAGDLESAIRADESSSDRDSPNSLSQGYRDEVPLGGEVFLVERRREAFLRYPRSGKWSLWLWRRWERGELGPSPLAQEDQTVESANWASTSAGAGAAFAPAAHVPSNTTLRHNAMFGQDGVECATYSPDHVLPVAQVVTASHSESRVLAMPAQAPTPHSTATSNPMEDPQRHVAPSGSGGRDGGWPTRALA